MSLSGRNVRWRLRWKLSVARTRTRRWTNSEIIFFLSPMNSLHIKELFTWFWGSDSLLMCSNVIFKLDVPSGVPFVSLSERSSSALTSAKWFQWQKRPLSFWCLRRLCTSKWAFPKRWDRQSWQHRCPSHLAAPLTSDLSLWSDRHSTMGSQSRWA